MSLENEHNHFLENPDKQETLAKENAWVEIIPDLDRLRTQLRKELQGLKRLLSQNSRGLKTATRVA